MRVLLIAVLAACAGGCYTWPHLYTAGLPLTEYYTDLGPDSIDVASYPEPQQRNYERFRAVCAECHTLARAVNCPTQSRTYWRFHLARMSAHSRMRHAGPLSKEDREAVLDFLEYDGRVRKVEQRERFLEQDEQLKKRFEPILQKQLYELYDKG